MEMEPEDEPKPSSVTIHVYGTPYTVVNNLVEIPNGGRKPKLYKRLTPKGKEQEAAIDMQKRIEEDVVDIQASRVRSACRPLLTHGLLH
tara:strand:- start:282 stop:548 length:267 start_codon:yes stop_codon:yes gene_type:complete